MSKVWFEFDLPDEEVPVDDPRVREIGELIVQFTRDLSKYATGEVYLGFEE